MITNNRQIELSLESRSVVNPTKNLTVTPVSVYFFNRLLNPDLLINIQGNDNFLNFNKICGVNQMDEYRKGEKQEYEKNKKSLEI